MYLPVDPALLRGREGATLCPHTQVVPLLLGTGPLEHERPGVATGALHRRCWPRRRRDVDFIGFNSDVGHYFVEVIEIDPELTDGP